jgi:hypothetical protein
VRLLEQFAVEPATAHRASRRTLFWIAVGLVALVVILGALAVVIGLKVFELISSGRGPL